MNTESEVKRPGHRNTLKVLSIQQLSALVFTRPSPVFLVKVAVNSLHVFNQCKKSEFELGFAVYRSVELSCCGMCLLFWQIL